MKRLLGFFLILLVALNANAATTRLLTGSQIDQGSFSGRNFIGNSVAAVNTAGWVTFADGAAYVDGTGGSPSGTFTRSTSGPLFGDANFVYTPGALGNGVSYAFTIDTAQKGKMNTISFDYAFTGTTPADGDVQVFIYDVTNSVIIQPAPYKIPALVAAIQGKFTTQFQASSSTSYRVSFYQSTSTSTYTLLLNNIRATPEKAGSQGVTVTDWTSFTPTGTWSANVAYTGKWRRVGDSAEIEETVTASGAPTGTQTFNLPSGLTIDTTKIGASDTGYNILGTGNAYDSGVNSYSLMVYYNSTTSVIPHNFNAAGTTAVDATVTATVPFSFGASDRVTVHFIVPIVGWSSNAVMSNDADSRVVSFQAHLNSTTASAANNTDTVIPYNTVDSDTHGGFNTSSHAYIVQVPGDYVFHAVLESSPNYGTASDVSFSLYVNGANRNMLARGAANTVFPGSTVTNINIYADAVAYGLKAGDSVTIVIIQNSGGSISVGNAGNRVSYVFSGHRLGGPTQIAASETIAARAHASATSISGSLATVVWTTTDWDDHSGLASGVYTAPSSGKYHVTCRVEVSGTFALNSQTDLQLQQNGTAVAEDLRYAGGIITNDSVYVSDDVHALAGDTIRCQISSGATGPAIVSSNTKNFFSIARVGNY